MCRSFNLHTLSRHAISTLKDNLIWSILGCSSDILCTISKFKTLLATIGLEGSVAIFYTLSQILVLVSLLTVS